MGAGIWAAENTTDGAGVACCTSGTGEFLIHTNLARELCRGILQDSSAFLADIVAKQPSTMGSQYVGALLLQTWNWSATGKGFLHVLHNTPTFCWAMTSTKSRNTKVLAGNKPLLMTGFLLSFHASRSEISNLQTLQAEMSVNLTAAGPTGPTGRLEVVTLGYSV